MTFETWNDEAIEIGATDDLGFIYQGLEFSSLAKMADEIRERGQAEPSSSQVSSCTWFTTKTPEFNLRTGVKTYYSFHPKGLTDEEMAELNYLLTVPHGLFYSIYNRGN